MDSRTEIRLHMAAAALLVVGGVAWAVYAAADVNVLAALNDATGGVAGTAVGLAVGLAAAWCLLRRDFYLPFLGQTALPCDALVEKTPADADVAVTVRGLAPGTNVVYWAAERVEEVGRVVASPWAAYDRYTNTGVARADAQGVAVLRVRRPVAYQVPSGRTLAPHVHYRVCRGGGLLGRVLTAPLTS